MADPVEGMTAVLAARSRIEVLGQRSAVADGDLQSRQSRFAGVLGRARDAATPRDRAREAAEQLVSIALVQPLLGHLRSTNRAAPPWAPSQGERQFQSMLDAQVSQSIVKAGRLALVDRLAEAMLRRSAPGEPAGAESKGV